MNEAAPTASDAASPRVEVAPQLRDASLDDRYARESGRVLLSGTQALVRLLLAQRARDAANGLNTAGFVSGYRGSPLGGFDQQLWKERRRLEAAQVRFQPGVNEDLAATAVWGTQQLEMVPGATVDGVFALWYGKGPGVDRSGDPIKHGNRAGTSKHGGVLVVFGDDHPGKSSTIAHQSEQALSANGLPVLYPATVQEYLDLGLHGIALSRYAGVWVGFKCVNDTIETTGTVDVDPARLRFVDPPDGVFPPEGVHIRTSMLDVGGEERRLMRFRLPLAQAYVRANGLDRVTHGTATVADEPGRAAGSHDGGSTRRASLGIVTAGKSWLDVVQALQALGLDEPRLRELDVAVYKPAMIWPLEPQRLTSFARGRTELLVVEEKAAFVEPQAAHTLYNLPDAERPRLVGKRCEHGETLLAADVPLEPLEIARVIAVRLRALGRADTALEARLALIERGLDATRARESAPIARIPHFCSGCPHNTSTKVPEGSTAMAGIGCHTMAIYMGRNTLSPTQMGGEGLNWTGIAPFTSTPHVFQNLGDGTYFHSGLLAIRGAVTAGVNVTYKILVNDAVAMTGGQPVEGRLSVEEITHQLRAERVQRIAVVSDEPAKYGAAPNFPKGTTVHDRDQLDAVQRELRDIPGVTAIVYDQTCAAEKRRRRKRGTLPDPDTRVLINELVCEGCGDCTVRSNCVSVEPLETEFGRKRRIDQSSCNKDYSCVKGFCPSFVTVSGASVRKPAAATLGAELFANLPDPSRVDVSTGTRVVSVLVTGIGGTGVVTVGAVLAMAAHLESLAATVFDMTGLSQKGGAVLSHLKIAGERESIAAPKVGALEADVVLGCDLVVTGAGDVLRAVDPGRTQAVLNTHLTPTAAFQMNPDVDFRERDVAAAIERVFGGDRIHRFDANRAALALLGDTLGTNMMVVGHALQKGWLPVGVAAVERAIELNGTAVDFNLRALRLGRLAAHAPERFASLLAQQADATRSGPRVPPIADGAGSLAERIAVRERFLVDYQDAAYAARYRALVDRVAARERERVSGETALTEVVARGYFKLLAYKDEYEVARLHSTTLRGQLEAAFTGDFRVTFHLAPPLLAKTDPATGQPRKREYGAWMLTAMTWLAKAKRLRGTAFDPFGRTAERRMERQLIADYERTIDELLATLDPSRHTVAVQIARVPEQIRGYGHVKDRNVAAAKRREADLLAQFRAPATSGGAAARIAAAPER
jgi:indolepyruvate ferredoxin oxidoreductase